jgi:hypothetical protein
MLKSALLAAIRQEIHRHDLSHFMGEENQRVVPGCPKCRKASTRFRSSSITSAIMCCRLCWTGFHLSEDSCLQAKRALLPWKSEPPRLYRGFCFPIAFTAFTRLMYASCQSSGKTSE